MHATPRDPARYLPEKKVTAAGGAGGVALVLVWLASLAGLDMPEAVAHGFVYLAALVAAYLAPHTRRDDTEEA
ncbi:hypothetical protein ACOQFV_27270 [Nocardiopsis changdeensis]|uniref:Uncharacterized protein n=1 Tax=Nocardiopsis changdeensis TaxID=2831969 RepID=A0ABX8BL67_9ACTN|nr:MULTISPECIES: hypothetical protein [Nocardiopsis]QUX22969.1 hypothetical protein KGD84_00730 [Nocardiopsis changdeensis]QYX38912.1 hypothetical protein K1J57_10180 [Nocardiopsis sp. MT53]